MLRKNVTRRPLIIIGSLFSLVLLLGLNVVQAQGRTIKIGYTDPLSGPFLRMLGMLGRWFSRDGR